MEQLSLTTSFSIPKKGIVLAAILGISGMIIAFLLTEHFATSNYPASIKLPVSRANVMEEIIYESFGAVGDGVTDDVEAIRAAHDYANILYRETGVFPTVYGTPGATYYIGNVDPAIEINTNVDWRNSSFILDDYIDADGDGENDVNYRNDVFVVRSLHDSLNLGKPNALPGINTIEVNTKTEDFSNLLEYLRRVTAEDIANNGGSVLLDYQLATAIKPGLLQGDELLVRVVNSAVKYERRGQDGSSYTEQQEFFLIDINGNVLTEIFRNFEDISKLEIFPVDKELLTIRNGNFLSYTNNKVVDENGNSADFTYRGIQVCRANVTLDNIQHMLDESMHEVTPTGQQTNGQGNKYLGFVRTYYGAAHFVFQNSTITPHQTINGTSGTYDISLNNVVGVHLNNISYPSPDGNDAKWYTLYIANVAGRWERWGIMASNHAKNVVIENSKLNRIDSHSGVWNLTVKNTTVGQYGFTLAGGGKFTAENVIIDGSNYAINLRTDYGSTWLGQMELENVTMVLPAMEAYIIRYQNDGGWDFGLDCYYPNIIIRNLRIDDTATSSNISLIPIHPPAVTRVAAYNFSSYIRMQNVKLTSGRTFSVFPSTNYLGMHLYGTGKKTEVYLSGIDLTETDVTRYNTANSQFVVYLEN